MSQLIPPHKVTSEQLHVYRFGWFFGYQWGIYNPGNLISLLTEISLQYDITITTVNVDSNLFRMRKLIVSRSQWSRDLRRKSVAARLLRSWVRIPPGAWMFVCSECCMLSGRGLCYELITRPEESYRTLCDVVCDVETSWMRRPWPTGGCRAEDKQTNDTLEWTTVILRKLAGVWGETVTSRINFSSLASYTESQPGHCLRCSVIRGFPQSLHINAGWISSTLRCNTQPSKVHQWQIIKDWKKKNNEAVIEIIRLLHHKSGKLQCK